MLNRRTISALLMLAFCAQGSAGDQAGPGIVRLGTLGGPRSTPSDVTLIPTAIVIGQAMTSTLADHAFRWSSASGMQDLGTFGGVSSKAWSISGDAAIIVGDSETPRGFDRAFRWTMSSGMVSFLVDRDSVALAISQNGSFIGGRIRTDTGYSAYRWSEAQGMQLLSDLGGPFSQAEAVTDDGSVIAGSSATAGGPNVMYRAVRWLDGQIQDLGSFAGYPSYATGMSNDGQVVVGGAVNADGYFRAFRWTQQSGIEYIYSADSLGAFALDVSADGSVVVGSMYLPNNRQRAFRWTRQAGMQTVEDWLRSHGAVVPEDITKNATGVSADGTAVVGELSDFTGFLAIEPEIKLPQPVPAFKDGWLLALLMVVFWSGVAHWRISGPAR